jgi:hypothetical protein
LVLELEMPIQDAKHWLSTQRWRRRSRQFLMENPLCAMCSAEGRVEVAIASDHVVPHRNDPKLFWFGQLRELCSHHHGSLKQKLENGSRIIRVDVHGNVIDETEELRNKWMSRDEG